MENGNRQPSTSRNLPPPAPAPTVNNYHVVVIPPNPFRVQIYIPTRIRVAPQGHQVLRFQLPENENQNPPRLLRPPMVNALPVVHGPSWPFIPGPGIGQPINLPVLPLALQDVRYLNLDATIASVPGSPLAGHGVSMRLIGHYRQQWLADHQRVMNQITQLEHSLAALKTRETCLFTPLKIMMTQEFNALPQGRRVANQDVFQSFYDSLENRIHNSGSSDIVGLHVQCIKTSLNCMRNFLTPGNATAPPPPGAGVMVPENPPGLHMNHPH